MTGKGHHLTVISAQEAGNFTEAKDRVEAAPPDSVHCGIRTELPKPRGLACFVRVDLNSDARIDACKCHDGDHNTLR